MAGRKEKSTLDFIQLDCIDKTTFKRLNRKFGKEGRLFLIDLLRLLGRTEWYILDLSDEDILEDIMIDELDIDKKTGIEILNQLAKWGFICEKTWLEHQNIWCQNLIDRHIELFNKRRKIPANPFELELKEDKLNLSGINRIDSAEMQQSKVNKSKVNKTSEEEKNALDYLKNSDFDYLTFEMQNKKNVKDWDLMLENYCYKVDQEDLEYTVKKLEARLRQWMGNWIRNENKNKKPPPEIQSKSQSNLNELEKARKLLHQS